MSHAHPRPSAEPVTAGALSAHADPRRQHPETGGDGALPAEVRVAFCPAPPLLLPLVAGTAAAETDLLRAACRDAVATVLGDAPDIVLVVADGPPGIRYGAGDAADLTGYGLPHPLPFAGRVRPGGRAMPLPFGLGAWLLDGACHGGVRLGVAAADLGRVLGELRDVRGPVPLLVMGEGSARRSEKAPGHLDRAAAPFDAAVATALAGGDAAGLAGLDPGEGVRLLAAGVPVWRAVGAALSGRSVQASLGYDDAPFGVGYLVATWLSGPSAPSGPSA